MWLRNNWNNVGYEAIKNYVDLGGSGNNFPFLQI